MNPLSVYIVPRRQVEALTSTPPIPQADLNEYLSVRPGILSDGACDIWQPNVRSETQSNTRFDLWNIVDHVESGIVVVFPPWLELFHAFGQRQQISTCIDWLACTYPGNPIVVQWNSDTDAATMPEFCDLPDNFFVLQFNTSKPSPNDILLPAWAIETRQKWDVNADRPMRGGFIGYVGGVKVRQAMKRAFDGRVFWDIVATEERGSFSHEKYISHLLQWDFALCPRGGGISSYRFWEALQCGCIPILFADGVSSGTTCTLPFPDLEWDRMIVHLPEQWASSFDVVMKTINHPEVGDLDVKDYRNRIAEVRERFTLAGVQCAIAKRIWEYLS